MIGSGHTRLGCGFERITTICLCIVFSLLIFITTLSSPQAIARWAVVQPGDCEFALHCCA